MDTALFVFPEDFPSTGRVQNMISLTKKNGETMAGG